MSAFDAPQLLKRSRTRHVQSTSAPFCTAPLPTSLYTTDHFFARESPEPANCSPQSVFNATYVDVCSRSQRLCRRLRLFRKLNSLQLLSCVSDSVAGDQWTHYNVTLLQKFNALDALYKFNYSQQTCVVCHANLPSAHNIGSEEQCSTPNCSSCCVRVNGLVVCYRCIQSVHLIDNVSHVIADMIQSDAAAFDDIDRQVESLTRLVDHSGLGVP